MKRWTKSEAADLRRCYARMSRADLEKKFGCEFSVIENKAHRLGLRRACRRDWKAIARTYVPTIIGPRRSPV